ncbi:sensor histidine kinase [Luxibacter massiliensis]|uniref:sensor histidine kinase n=1 Tax=Luxibacter massiliensis TaxID=2219695 RepID=UPI000F06EC53|nr:HAMP domain-containing sensor histidine kinase [Luxibacter massiliensis]
MIKKLRIKFILASIIAMVAVLFILLGSIHIMNYRKIIRDAENILDVLSENSGAFPIEDFRFEKPSPDKFSPETPFESRYFTVEMKKDGTILKTNLGRIAAVDKYTAEEYGEEVGKKSKTGGFIANYRYRKEDLGGQNMMIIFLDCGKSLSTFYDFLITSLLVSVLGVGAVFVLLVFVSGRIVQPFALSYEKQKRFITDAGHEIKTPLTIIDADAAVLEMEAGENEWIQDIQKQTQRLKELTNDLIYLSRMEEKPGHIQMTDFPISEIAIETAESFQSIAKMQNKKFTYEIQPMAGYRGVPEEIRRLFSILLDNAMKYSDEQGAIFFQLKQRGKSICIIVFNTVDFIETEQLQYLFDRFYRTDVSRNSQTRGYGIGLSIARAIVLAHKGKITVSSENGRTILFTVLL